MLLLTEEEEDEEDGVLDTVPLEDRESLVAEELMFVPEDEALSVDTEFVEGEDGVEAALSLDEEGRNDGNDDDADASINWGARKCKGVYGGIQNF